MEDLAGGQKTPDCDDDDDVTKGIDGRSNASGDPVLLLVLSFEVVT